MENTHIVIMAGGIGSRLWPISSPDHPKQFMDLLGMGKSLIQLTVDRFLPICDISHFWIVTSYRYVEMVKEQLPQIPQQQILAEPEPRNTAPCIAYACWKIASKFPDANIVVTPSDAVVLQTEKFAKVMEKSLFLTNNSSAIVTIGIPPTRPETGYGYICASSKVWDSVIKVAEFKEKPDLKTAMEYLKAGNYFWNAGIFVWNVNTIITELRQYAPGISAVMDELLPSFYTDNEQTELKRLFGTCDKISIDYAVMEKSKKIYLIASNLGWSDLGTWASLMKFIPSGEDNNAVVCDNARLFNCSNCVVHADGLKSVVIEGLHGYIVSEKEGNLLICELKEEQNIREFSQNKSK